ncbi:MAG: hypothetical protein LBJ44_12010 [Propionibacteriaceae bacterium]|nr:hypothetical protein [Propionibacteriaceae bacterium]
MVRRLGWLVSVVSLVAVLVASGLNMTRPGAFSAAVGPARPAAVESPVCVWEGQSTTIWLRRSCDGGRWERATLEQWRDAGRPAIRWRPQLSGVTVAKLPWSDLVYLVAAWMPLGDRVVAASGPVLASAGSPEPEVRDFIPGLIAQQFANPFAPNVYLRAPISGALHEATAEEWAALSDFTPLRAVEVIPGIENPTVVAQRQAEEETQRQAEAEAQGGRPSSSRPSSGGGSTSGSGSSGGGSYSGGGSSAGGGFEIPPLPTYTSPGEIYLRCHEDEGKARLVSSWPHAGSFTGTATVNGSSWTIPAGASGFNGRSPVLLPPGQNVCTVVLGGVTRTASF